MPPLPQPDQPDQPARWDAEREATRWDKILKDCRSRWDADRTYREKNIKVFKEGAFPLSKDGKSSEGCNVNNIFLYAKSTMALLYGSDPVIQIDPRRATEERAFADAMEGWLTYSHTESNTEETDGAAIFYALLMGLAWTKEGFDPDARMDVVDALSPLEVAVDPTARYSLAQARWIIQLVTQPVEEARAFFQRQDIEPNYTLGETEGLERERLLDKEKSSSSDKDLYQYFEIWERLPGGSRNLLYRDPKKAKWLDMRDWPFVLSRTEFPFSPLCWNTQYQGIDGFSELDVVAGLRSLIQELFEFDRRHTLRAAAKKILVNSAVWDDEKLDSALSSKDLEPIRLNVPAGQSVNDTYTVLNFNTPTDIEDAKLTRAKLTHDEMLGFSELQRGVAVRQKTATESEIEDEWSKSRFQSSIRAIDKWKRRSLTHRAQISRQLVDPADVAAAVGEEAAQVWMQYAGDAEDLIRNYTIAIKAGSTGEHARRKNVEEAQSNLELFSGVNAQLMQMGMPPRFDIIELGLDVARAKEVRNPDRYLLPIPQPQAPAPAGLEQVGQGQPPPQQAPAPMPPEEMGVPAQDMMPQAPPVGPEMPPVPNPRWIEQ